MRLSPVLGLPIAEQDDARRDFPLTVDDPRTMAIEAALTPAAARVQWGTAQSMAGGVWAPVAHAPAGPDNSTHGGATVDGTGMVTLPKAGLYRASAQILQTPAGSATRGIAFSIDGGSGTGNGGFGTYSGQAAIVATALLSIAAAGATLQVSTYCSAAFTLDTAHMQVEYVGPL